MVVRILIVLWLLALPVRAIAADEQVATPRMDHIKSLMIERQEQKAAVAAESSKNSMNGTESTSGTGLRMLQALFLCLGVFFVGVFLYRKKTGNAPIKRSGRLKIVDRMMVAPKTSLILAEVDGREVLLAVGSDQVSFFPAPARTEGSHDLGLVCRDTETLPIAMHS